MKFYETYENTIFTFQIDKMNQKEKKVLKTNPAFEIDKLYEISG